jgi:membrane protein YqaA with SNARE-associated domain/membrane-associated phospholipid phosphatase
MGRWMAGTAYFFMHYGVSGLFILSFVEASFFPVPPYLLSIPMTLANPQLGLFYALVGTAGSVSGGLFGYALGVKLGRPLLVKIIKPATLVKFENIYQRYGDWATAVGGVTPLPYKIFAIAAGVFRTRLATFIPASIFARGIRFFGEALLLMWYGRKVLKFLKSAFGPADLIIVTVLLLIAIVVWRSGWMPRPRARQFLLLGRELRGAWLAWTGRIRQKLFPAGIYGWYLVTGATITAFGFLVFAKLASELLEQELAHFDMIVGNWIITCRSGPLTLLMREITVLGSTGWVIGLIIVITAAGFYFRKHRSILALNLDVLGALGLSELLKGTFHRSRPPLPWFTSAGGYSFPSGHALISLALYGFLAYLIFRNSQWPRLRYGLVISLILLPILIGISRVYLGVHYPSDVLAGWAVAAGWIGTCVVGMEYINSKFYRER